MSFESIHFDSSQLHLFGCCTRGHALPSKLHPSLDSVSCRADDPTKAVEVKVYNQPVSTNVLTQLSHGEAHLAKVEEALASQLSQSCIYLQAGWWTYELCYLRHLRQVHVASAGSPEQVHILGEPSFPTFWPSMMTSFVYVKLSAMMYTARYSCLRMLFCLRSVKP